jgi:hypothetical protein
MPAIILRKKAGWALPHGEFGLDVIAAIGEWRFAEHRSVPEMHQRLIAQGVTISEREVTHRMQRYEELVAMHIADQKRLQERLRTQKRVLLAIDGLQPDVGHEVFCCIKQLSRPLLLNRNLPQRSLHPSRRSANRSLLLRRSTTPITQNPLPRPQLESL